MTPSALGLHETFRFVSEAVRGCTRILEVGCGDGSLARMLGADGLSVTAIDRELEDLSPAPGVRFVERDFFGFDDQPYEAIVFTRSLHHLAPLDAALARATKLLAPGGMLVADEFDLDAPRALTCRWYYDVQELLAAAELYPAERIDRGGTEDARTRWLDAHVHEPPLATGRQMLAAIASKFAIRDSQRCPYLYRYVASGLPADERGGKVAQHVLSVEQRRIAAGTMDAVGIQVIALRAS